VLEVALRVLWMLWTRTPLGRVTNAMIDRLPPALRGWVARQKQRLREQRKRIVRRRGNHLSELGEQDLLQLRLRGKHLLVPERELEETYRHVLRLLAVRAGPDGVGDYLEFGVYIGTSLLCMHRASEAVGLPSLRLFGFDSFAGLPESAAKEEGRWHPGQFRAAYDVARAYLSKAGVDWSRTALVPGWFEDTLRPELAHRLGIEKAGVIMIDCDIYSSAHIALGFSAPFIRDHTVVVLDDWHDGRTGEGTAWEEFLAANPDLTAEELGSYRQDSKVFLVTRRRT
jgi:predicted O-methyltransferase YrrM